MSAARDAAIALGRLAMTSGVVPRLVDVHGVGVIYRPFATDAEALEYARSPALDARTTFSTQERASAHGDVAVGFMKGFPTHTIAVVDVLESQRRVTVVDDGATTLVEQELELVPVSVPVAAPPTAVADDDPACACVTAAIERTCALDSPAAHDRRVYYVDARVDALDDAGGFDCIDEDAFTKTMASLESIQLTAPATLVALKQLHASHDPARYVIAWMRRDDDVEAVWLVQRRR